MVGRMGVLALAEALGFLCGSRACGGRCTDSVAALVPRRNARRSELVGWRRMSRTRHIWWRPRRGATRFKEAEG
jgi:hypothetical protein